MFSYKFFLYSRNSSRAPSYTFDFWQTVEEVSANFKQSAAKEHENYVGVDEFDFSINLEERISLKLGSPKKTMFFAVKYQANGEEFWDNNDGMNYHVEFVLSKVRNANDQWDNQSQSVAVNKSQPIKMKKCAFEIPDSNNLSDTPLTSLRSASTKKLSSRYDFGASLSALLASEACNSQNQLEPSNYFDFPTSDQIDQQYKTYYAPSAYTTSSSLSQMLNHEYDSYSSVSVESPFGNNSWEEPGYLLDAYDSFSHNYVSNSSIVAPKPIPSGNNANTMRGINDSGHNKHHSYTGSPLKLSSYGVSPPATCIRG
ncbi:hypothetical protein K7432_015991 [Basidiobolus ranarum]|uniref:CBM21 domain-containing protein n=1 Tax=Basidiobolus ranarum TaxID=34480 RepID=A0ABR2VM87_9FUNG